MRCVVDADLTEYAGHVLPWLLNDPVSNNVAYLIVEQRRTGALPTEPDALWARVLDSDNRLVGIALRTPPFGLLVSGMPHAAAEALATTLAELNPALPLVTGPSQVSSAFAHRYAELTGATAVSGMAQRIYRLDTVTAPVDVPGRLREATTADRGLLLEWHTAFATEAMPHQTHDPEPGIDTRLAEGSMLWFWDVDGTAVSMAYLNPPTAGVVRVSGVYTPPQLRGRGYASACVAAVSQQTLDRGATACMLYTDLANPTSNSIYQRIGYRPVAEVQDWRFDHASSPTAG